MEAYYASDMLIVHEKNKCFFCAPKTTKGDVNLQVFSVVHCVAVIVFSNNRSVRGLWYSIYVYELFLGSLEQNNSARFAELPASPNHFPAYSICLLLNFSINQLPEKSWTLSQWIFIHFHSYFNARTAFGKM